jgi:hypothetical protein
MAIRILSAIDPRCDTAAHKLSAASFDLAAGDFLGRQV